MAASWQPWHQIVQLRPDLKSGELSLAQFAADLYDVVMGTARPIYQHPTEFFALTYPTYALRELARDVAQRLAGQNDKAVRQLELTYGGGKTHTLITLYHLTRDPAALPHLPAVQEFIQHMGLTPPQARVAVLAFDKLDVEKGMEVLAPDGSRRWLRQPWSVLAYQLAGDEGLRLLHAESQPEERESAPAENLLTELLAVPGREGLATLILLDEVLMYAREKVGQDERWKTSLVNFFQYLTQAATKIDRCAMVASLLATDPAKSDRLGKQIISELSAIFRRQREESVEPVGKEDVAEVLRRRFFTPDSLQNRDAFRAHVLAALQGVLALDEPSRKDPKGTEERFLRSYPFHPDLTEIFYTKWTGLEGFQRTRGTLRTFALALRDAEKWDNSPLAGVNIFLGQPDSHHLGEAARELTNIAAAEEYEGKRQEWNAILLGELEKARQIQADYPGLDHREMERAVFATFLHSQPIGQKALLRDLLLLIGETRPDRIELGKALLYWTQTSWFLDEATVQEAGSVANDLPKTWRLGSRPNLTQMHHDACDRIPGEIVETTLLEEIRKLKSLTQGASAMGVRVHNLPERPRDIEDDGNFHYAVLGPRAASRPGHPGDEATRFINETTGPDKPRVYRNALVLAVPSLDGLDAAYNRVLEYLGWQEVHSQLASQEVEAMRLDMLSVSLAKAKARVPEAIQQAYSIAITVDENNQIEAFKLAVSHEPLFVTIKNNPRARIQDTAITADALLPEGPYNLWHEGETARRAQNLVTAFAQLPRLPKMLNSKAIYDTLAAGCQEGFFVLRLTRPDRSQKTFWRHLPSDLPLDDPALEVVLPQAATLTDLPVGLLKPGALPALADDDAFTFAKLQQYFGGDHVAYLQKGGYEEPLFIPKVERRVLEETVQYAVERDLLWLTAGPASIYREPIPAGVLNDQAVLQAPPQPIRIIDILPGALNPAWTAADNTTTALAIASALSQQHGQNLPWAVVRQAIDGTLKAHYLEVLPGSAPWPCEYPMAGQVRLRVPIDSPPPQALPTGTLKAKAEISPVELQDLAEVVGDLVEASVGHALKFDLSIELGEEAKPPKEVIEKINKILESISDKLQLK